MEWWENIEPKVFNTVKVRLSKAFPKLFCTSQAQLVSESRFPCVYIHVVDMREIGSDFEHTDMCGMDVTFQGDIYVNTDQSDCTAIAAAVTSQLKKLRLTIQGPFYYSAVGSNVVHGIVRASRLYGANDNL